MQTRSALDSVSLRSLTVQGGARTAPPLPAPSIRSGATAALSGLSPLAGQHGWAEMSTPARSAIGVARVDQLQVSPRGRALGALSWTWRVLGELFGRPASAGPDLAGLQQALQEARERVQAVNERNEILQTLKSSALAGAEVLVREAYGLEADGAQMQVELEKEMGSSLAAVSYAYDSRGRMADLTLHINVSQFVPDTGPNGKNEHVIENDRIIAHELTHAVMGRNMDVSQLPDWFMEGTAEYVAGAAERVALSLRRMSPGGLLGRVLQPWYGDSPQYAAAYLAVRYLDTATAASGGIRGIMARLRNGESLDEAVYQGSGGRYEDAADFLIQFARGGEGEAWMKTIDLTGRDPGSIRAGKGPQIVPDGGRPKEQPLRGFRIDWPSPLAGIDFLGSLSPGWGLFGSGRPLGASVVDRQSAASAYRLQQSLAST
jgi:hypothetical protein